MNLPIKLNDYQKRVAHDIAESVCRPCTDPRRLNHDLDFDDPLACGCRCATVERLLMRLSSRNGG